MIINIKSYPNLSDVEITFRGENDALVYTATPSYIDNDLYRVTVNLSSLPLGFYRANLTSNDVLKTAVAIQVIDNIEARVDESISVLKLWNTVIESSEEVGSFTVAVPSVLENSGYDPNRLIQYRGTTWNFNIYDLGDISNLTKIYFTLRKQNSDDESKSLVQIEKTAGLLISNGLVALEANLGSLTVIDDEEGVIQIKVSAEETKYYPSNTDNFVYDLKGILANNEVKLVHKSKEFIISSDVTRKIT
jgi:hypothetical protein